MTALDSKETLISWFEDMERQLNGLRSSNFHQTRQEAFEQFKQLDYPSTKHEEWKYTNVKRILKSEFEFNQSASLSQDQLTPFLIDGLDAQVMVFVNGQFNASLSQLETVDGLAFDNLKAAYASHQEDIDQHFGKYATIGDNPFTALNTAFANDGAFIKVNRSKVIEKPLVLLYVADAQHNDIASQPRNLVLVGENAQVTLIEQFITLGEGKSFSNVVTEFVVEQSALVDHYKLQYDAASYHIGTTQVYQKGKSHFANTTISLDGELIRNNLNIEMDGEYVESYMNGLYMLDGKTHVDNHTSVDHQLPNSYSNELYKGILDGNSTGVFNGKIYVREDAQKTNAFQQNNNILLSDKATIDTKPQLEIWADDVKCSHGATVGSLDEEPLFYLRSRGISEEKARSLLMFAFAGDLLDRIKVEALRTHVEAKIAKRLDYKV
ncbi:MAG: Fe-S cluster assembly protein SufD [Flammeovirgaceae bacterium]